MCGIAGTFGTDADISAMLDRIAHRGPDGRGVMANSGAMHGHVRLSLVDLSDASSQPFAHKGATLTFNGEIWNYRELREELINIGEKFRTTGDTEVLAVLLSRHGLDGLKKVNGMFAFAWSDGKGGHWLVRDRFGEIPLYVAKCGYGFKWSSERKAFDKGEKPIAVPPAHVFDMTIGKFVRWYSLPNPSGISSSEVLDLLRQGVRRRLDADAPVCCLISGGLDSSIILSLAKETGRQVVAYTAVHDPTTGDAVSARRLCRDLGIELVEVKVRASFEGIVDAIRSIEIPSKVQVEVATLCLPLAKRIYDDGFRACLSGEAADELFGGYGNFSIKAHRLPNHKVIALRKELLAKMARGNFIRCNKAFMAYGVECRLPFMEDTLVERCVQLGKDESPPGKKLLKEAAKEVLPLWVVRRIKDTFQGGSGISSSISRIVASPNIIYNMEARKVFGYLPKD